VEPIEFLKEVETTYDVKSIKVKGVEVWPFLRWPYASAYGIKHAFKISAPKPSLWSKIKRVRNIFYGFLNLFQGYNYMLFSDTMEIRMINDRYVNKLAEILTSELGKKRILYIENPAAKPHFKRSEISVRKIISLDLFNIICYLLHIVNRKKLVIDNETILMEISRKYDLDFDYTALISHFFCYIELFRYLFMAYKPRIVFVSQYYGIHQAVIYAAKKQGIKTIELQHGIISKGHLAYNVFMELDKSFFPDYLFAFGDYVKNVFDEDNHFMNKENVVAIGSMYIDYINNEYKPSAEITTLFKSLRNKYKKIITISSQWILENELIDFLIKSASLSRDVLYVFVPRVMNKDYSNANFPENVILLKDLDVYQIIREADVHSTMWSTCALEAPALGVPNALINIRGFAEKYYLNVLTNRAVTKFVDTPEDFVETILNWEVKTKEEIKRLHRNFYKQNYKQNLKQALLIVESNRNPDWNM